MKTKTVTLAHPHTHAGKPYQPGQVLVLPAHDAAWLIQHKRATPGGVVASEVASTDTSATEPGDTQAKDV